MVTAGMVHSSLGVVGAPGGSATSTVLQGVCQWRHAHPFIKSGQIGSNAQSIPAHDFGAEATAVSRDASNVQRTDESACMFENSPARALIHGDEIKVRPWQHDATRYSQFGFADQVSNRKRSRP
jgi:hypothetical protein